MCFCRYLYPPMRGRPFQLRVEYFEFRLASELQMLMAQCISTASQEASRKITVKCLPKDKIK